MAADLAPGMGSTATISPLARRASSAMGLFLTPTAPQCECVDQQGDAGEQEPLDCVAEMIVGNRVGRRRGAGRETGSGRPGDETHAADTVRSDRPADQPAPVSAPGIWVLRP